MSGLTLIKHKASIAGILYEQQINLQGSTSSESSTDSRYDIIIGKERAIGGSDDSHDPLRRGSYTPFIDAKIGYDNNIKGGKDKGRTLYTNDKDAHKNTSIITYHIQVQHIFMLILLLLVSFFVIPWLMNTSNDITSNHNLKPSRFGSSKSNLLTPEYGIGNITSSALSTKVSDSFESFIEGSASFIKAAPAISSVCAMEVLDYISEHEIPAHLAKHTILNNKLTLNAGTRRRKHGVIQEAKGNLLLYLRSIIFKTLTGIPASIARVFIKAFSAVFHFP
jgi:hypothetical protein